MSHSTTIFHDKALALGAKLVSFSGWMMPREYSSITEEHEAVRTSAGLFDVSHMGKIEVSGKDTLSFLDGLAVTKVQGKPDGLAIYTVFCKESGEPIDDLILFKLSDTHFYIIANASNRDAVLNHLQSQASGLDVQVSAQFEKDVILALQGPHSIEIAKTLFPELDGLKRMRCIETSYGGKRVLLSTTGYTGEKGIELVTDHQTGLAIWDLFLKDPRVKPCGLGARDTLRLEMGYALFGHELNKLIFPHESVSAWTVHLEKEDFLGKEAITQKTPLSFPAAALVERGIAREGMEVYDGDEEIGVVTSGTFSPSLKKGIALLHLSKKVDENSKLTVNIRDKRVPLTLTTLPFYKKDTK